MLRCYHDAYFSSWSSENAATASLLENKTHRYWGLPVSSSQVQEFEE